MPANPIGWCEIAGADRAVPPRPYPNGRGEPASSTIVAAALDLASRGWPVFPCGPDKRPLTEHGFKDASTDPKTIYRAFSNPRAHMIGVPTGSISGFDVLDLDPRHGSDAWRAAHIELLPDTRVHKTAGGGEHWLLRHADGLRNSSGKIAPGLDVRAEGGYVIVPPSSGYSVIKEANLAPWPPELLKDLLRTQEPKAAKPAIEPRRKTDQLEKRYRGFVESLLQNVRRAADGQKHATLLANARALGGVIGVAKISEADAHAWLMSALPETVADWNSAAKTASDGLRAGMLAPIDLEERWQGSAPPPSQATWQGSNGQDHGNPQREPVAEANPPKPKRKKHALNALELVNFMTGSREWHGALRVNLFTETMQVCDQFPPLQPASGAYRTLREPADLLEAMLYFQGSGFAKAGKSLVWDALCVIANRNAFHPVQDYLNGRQWDGEPRLGRLFQVYFNGELPDNAAEADRTIAYLEHISLCFMVSAVARIREPGCKVDYLPVLVGPQGYHKSQAIRALCADPAWFSDDLSTDLMERDTKESLTGKWIVELAEMPHARKEVERVKAFFSRTTDRYRRAYDRTTNDWPRQCVFMGSSNDLELIDHTGNRRNWPVEVAAPINVEKIVADRDQLWAEAVALHKSSYPWWLGANIEKIAGEQQSRFQDEDVWIGELSKWIDGDKSLPFTLAEAMIGALGFPNAKQIPKAEQNRASACLKSLGFRRRRTRSSDNNRPWLWTKEPSD